MSDEEIFGLIMTTVLLFLFYYIYLIKYDYFFNTRESRKTR